MKSYTILKAVTLISVLVSCGFAVLGVVRPELLVSPGLGPKQTLIVIASFAASRSIAVVVVYKFTLFAKKRESLYTIAALAALIHFFDFFVGLYEGGISNAVGPLVLAVAGYISIYYAYKSADTSHA